MTKRKTQLDRAIEGLDRDIEQAEGQLAVLHAARARIVAQQQSEATTKPATTGHPEGGRGI